MSWYEFFISLMASGISYFFGPEPPPPERFYERIPLQVQEYDGDIDDQVLERREVQEEKTDKGDSGWGWYVVPGSDKLN